MTIAARPLRTHQRQVFGLMAAIAAGEAPGITAALAAVTPGGGKSLLPVTFGALDGEASWLEGGKTTADPPRVGPHRLSGSYPTETTRPALFTALRTGFALELLQQAFKTTRALRAQRRAERGFSLGE